MMSWTGLLLFSRTRTTPLRYSTTCMATLATQTIFRICSTFYLINNLKYLKKYLYIYVYVTSSKILHTKNACTLTSILLSKKDFLYTKLHTVLLQENKTQMPANIGILPVVLKSKFSIFYSPIILGFLLSEMLFSRMHS
jgi:hypothetical protein